MTAVRATRPSQGNVDCLILGSDAALLLMVITHRCIQHTFEISVISINFSVTNVDCPRPDRHKRVKIDSDRIRGVKIEQLYHSLRDEIPSLDKSLLTKLEILQRAANRVENLSKGNEELRVQLRSMAIKLLQRHVGQFAGQKCPENID
ncbi:hypothetical protein BGW36DRAFT_356893 [Talaromyces proteolyticus]|uniref:BHLH domain-containing protein n=1 Tax=Talaromyces proteolyticus TaxID=1131652 RepID=A0AAD4KYM0_9EURO|nr:uncharacterized protein BGW36DRAFT_356893 [Talaromyces proteolyticus]KAH8700230.1 hypothetical protein BGW36DRAFT_356893 [Talaromyces proteolyticus]